MHFLEGWQDRCNRCTLRYLNLTHSIKQGELTNITVNCLGETLNTLSDFNISWTKPLQNCNHTRNCTPALSINKLTITDCNLSVFSFLKIVTELKPKRLSIGNSWYPLTLFPVQNFQIGNCMSHQGLTDNLKDIVELIYYHDSDPASHSTATFLDDMFRNMPNLQILSIAGSSGDGIANMITREMPSVTAFKLEGMDITFDVIKYVSTRMTGLKDICIKAMGFSRTPTKYQNMDTTDQFENVTSLTLELSGVNQDLPQILQHLPILQTLSISGVNGSEVIDTFNKDMLFMTKLEMTGTDIKSSVINHVLNKMKALKEIYIYSEYNNKTKTTKNGLDQTGNHI